MNVCAIHADDDDRLTALDRRRQADQRDQREDVRAPHRADDRGDDQRDLAVDADALVVDLDRLLVLALRDARMRDVVEQLFHFRNRRRLGAGWDGYVGHRHVSSTWVLGGGAQSRGIVNDANEHCVSCARISRGGATSPAVANGAGSRPADARRIRTSRRDVPAPPLASVPVARTRPDCSSSRRKFDGSYVTPLIASNTRRACGMVKRSGQQADRDVRPPELATQPLDGIHDDARMVEAERRQRVDRLPSRARLVGSQHRRVDEREVRDRGNPAARVALAGPPYVSSCSR